MAISRRRYRVPEVNKEYLASGGEAPGINRSWAGHEPDEYYRICSIAMGIEDGEMKTDLEKEHLPDWGHKISGATDDNGVQRIARVLSKAELAVKAQMEGKLPEEEEEDGNS